MIRIAVLILTSFTAPAFADSMITLNACEIQGELRLETDTLIACDGPLKIADDAVIVRNGFLLAFSSESFDGGKAHITCFDAESPTVSGNCEEMHIEALTLMGEPEVDTRGRNADDLGGDIILRYTSKNAFHPTYKLGYGAGVQNLTVAGR